MSLRRTAASGVVWMAFQSIFIKASSFAVLLVLARILEAADFGLVALAGVTIAFLQIFINAGFSSALIQRDTLDPEHLDAAFWGNLAMSALFITLMLISAENISIVFAQPKLEQVIRWLSLVLLFNALSQVQVAVLKRKMAFKALAIRSAVAEPFAGAVAVGLALSGFGVWSLVIREILSAAIKLVILWSTSRWRPKFSFSMSHFYQLFNFSIHMIATSLVQFASKRGVTALIGYFLGPTALGFYSIGERVLLMLTDLIGGTISSVAWPVFSRLQRDPGKVRSAYLDVTSIVGLAAWPLFMGLAATATDLIPALFGSKWNPVVPVIQTFAFLGLLQTMFAFNSSVILALGKPQWRLALNTAIAVLNVPLFFLVFHQGIAAVAMAYTCSWYLVSPLAVAMIKKLTDINLLNYFRLYVTPGVATLIMLAVILGVKKVYFPPQLDILHLAIQILAGAITYLIAVWFLSPDIVKKVWGVLSDLSKAR